MEEQKFIAISESEYNSFKHGEYERKIRELQDKISKLEEEKMEIAKAKAVRLETFSSFGCRFHTTITKLYSNYDFEDDILNDIKNTELKHFVDANLYIGFNKEDYVAVNGVNYYKNEWCEKLKQELSSLSYEIKSLEEKRDKLKFEIDILNNKLEYKDDKSFIKAVVEHFTKK